MRKPIVSEEDLVDARDLERESAERAKRAESAGPAPAPEECEARFHAHLYEKYGQPYGHPSQASFLERVAGIQDGTDKEKPHGFGGRG